MKAVALFFGGSVSYYCDLDGRDDTDMGYRRLLKREDRKLTVRPGQLKIIFF